MPTDKLEVSQAARKLEKELLEKVHAPAKETIKEAKVEKLETKKKAVG